MVIAGLNVLFFELKIKPVMGGWDRNGDTPAVAKTVAWVSLVAWTGVLLIGRLIPYVGTG